MRLEKKSLQGRSAYILSVHVKLFDEAWEEASTEQRCMLKEVKCMAVSKVLSSTSLAIEVENGVNGSGKVVYKKKNFSGIKINAAPENVFDVAEAIKGVLSNPARDYFLNETSKIANA